MSAVKLAKEYVLRVYTSSNMTICKLRRNLIEITDR
jgi:hypothetical protein